MAEWPRFMSHKVVRATPIVRIDAVEDQMPLLFVDPEGGTPEPFFPTEPGMADRCKVDDYAMIYRDGYKSVCPKKEFDDGYSSIHMSQPTS